MLTREICRLGYFDKVIVDGYILPFYTDDGLEIKDTQSVIEAIELNDAYNQGIARLRINIAGESINKKDDSLVEINRMRKHREKDLGLKRYNLKNKDRYYIGYMDIYIVKSDSLLPKLIEHTGKSFDDITKISKNNYELDMLSKAVELQTKIRKEIEDEDECNIAIIDKVYVQENFRRCKISTWMHENIGDLVKTFGMIDISAAILLPGDFSCEANDKFMMNKEEYEDILINHYNSVGYKLMKNNIMYKRLIKRKKILGII